ncbi:MAG: diguanylate cyclase [Rhodospirillales bacterium]|nr:diguanylate cyclase [Rhodospirillales bacterium]
MRLIKRFKNNNGISPFSCEFYSRELEDSFRQEKFADWTRRLQLGGVLGLLFYALLSISDYAQFANSLEFYKAIIARLVVVVICGSLIVFASLTKKPANADYYVLISSVIVTIVQSYIVEIKQMGTIFHALTSLLIVLHFYFLASNRFLFKIFTGGLISITYVIVANVTFDVSIHENLSLLFFLLICSNFIGGFISYREQRLERLEFTDSLRIEEEIHERNQVEAALKESEERYALAMKASSDHIYTWEAAEDKLTVALFKTEAFGIKDEPLTSSEWLARIHPEDVEGFRNRMIEHLHGKTETFNHEYRLRDDNDAYHHVRQHAIGKRGEDGRVSWMAGAAIDITEQKEAQENLRKSEEMYRAIFRNAGVGITLSDRYGKIFQCNEPWSELMGVDCRESCDQNCPTLEKVTHPDDLATLKENMEALTKGEIESCRFENRFVRKDKSVWWGGISLSPIHESDGTIQTFVGIVHDITSRKEHEEELRVYATTDGLTGADNRRSFMEKCEHELHRANRYSRPLSFLLLDLDHFKQVNDTHGHAAGDEALKQVTKFCQVTLRDEDTFGRIGGEEFAILLPENDKAAALEAAERLRHGISELTIKSEEIEFKLTASIGVASSHPEETTPDTVLKRADKALYAAKNGGRNCVEAA